MYDPGWHGLFGHVPGSCCLGCCGVEHCHMQSGEGFECRGPVSALGRWSLLSIALMSGFGCVCDHVG
jgi:hypothetical protein